MFDAEEFCSDYNILFKTEGKNSAPGWVQIEKCPYCGDPYGLGINIMADTAYANCWRCGRGYALNDVVQELLNVGYYEAKKIIRQYTKTSVLFEEKEQIVATNITVPGSQTALEGPYKEYLEKRYFDPIKLQKMYDLRQGSHIGPYKFRLIIPIILNNRIISYQGRDISGKSELRYKACPRDLEIINHKHSLYAVDMARSLGNKCIVVEGVPDQWRLGPGSVATFGTSYTEEQKLMIAEYFDHIFILFDPEEEAQQKAQKLAWDLSCFGKKTEILTGIDDDPGAMSDEDAKYLMRELKFKG